MSRWLRRTVADATQLGLSLCLIGALAAALSAAAAVQSRGGAVRVARARSAMGTLLEINAYGADGPSAEAAVAAAFRAVDEVERRLSNWRTDSELSAANSSRRVSLSPPTGRGLSAAVPLARESDRGLDPTGVA